MAETHELRLKINASAARAGANEFRGALKSIQKAVQELDRTSDGAFTSLRTGAKDAATATASATDRVATSSKTAGDRIKQMALASASALRTSQNEAQRLAERFNNLGDTQALTRLNAELAQLKTNLTNAQSGLDVRAARSSFADTSAELKRYANNLDASARAERQSIEGQRAHAASLDALRAKYNPLYSASKQYEAALEEISAAEKAGVISAQVAGSARERAAAQLSGASAAADQYGSALRRNAAATQQGIMVGHQLSDVLITAQMGFQSVGMIALQQGSQLASQFNSIRAAGGSLFGTLLSGFTSLVNPLTLITLAVVAVGAAVAKWFFSAGEETKSFADSLSDTTSAVSDLRSATQSLAGATLGSLADGYGRVNDELRVHLERLQQIAEIEAKDTTRDLIAALRDELVSDGNIFTTELDAIRRAFDTTNDSARFMVALLDDIGQAATLKEQAGYVTRLREEIERTTGGLDKAEGSARDLLIQVIKSEDVYKKLVAAADGTADATARGASSASSLASQLGTAADAARQLLATLGAVPGAVAALGRSVDQQISALQAQNESLNLQLNVGLSSEAANRRVQLNDLLKGGAITPDAAAKEFEKIGQLDALAKAQEALRKKLSEANKPAKSGGGGRVSQLGDEENQIKRLVEQMNTRIFKLDQENESLRLLSSGQAATQESAELMAAAMKLGGGAIDEQTMAMVRQYEQAVLLNQQLQKLAKDPVKDWLAAVPTWREAGRQIETEVFGHLSNTIATFIKTGEASFDALGDAILGTVADIVADMAVKELVGLLGGNVSGTGQGGFGLGGIIGAFFGSLADGGYSTAAPAMASAPLSAFRHAPHYASGTANTSGIPAILHDNEAVIPLSKGRKVPVEFGESAARGGGNMIQNFHWTVNAPDPDAFRKSQKQTLAEAGVASRKAMRDIR